MMRECIFCKIVHGEVPSESVFDSDRVYGFRDLNPQAPTHVLLIPKEHLESAGALDESHGDLLAEIFSAAAETAKAEGIADTGYRLVTNVGKDAGQTVFHLHFHLIGGRAMGWPPG